MDLDADHCYRAVSVKDQRFDGQFITAVRTTGIYCRPSCPAITPKRQNVEFFRTAAAAHDHGYRACKRCRPDAAPGSPEWDVRGDLVGRAMRLVADGVVDREGVAGLARRLHYSERQLNRLVTAELGAGPLRIARAQRAHTARTLIETSELTFTIIAGAAGFGSLRQFNDTVRAVYGATPTELRRNSAHAPAPSPTQVLKRSRVLSVHPGGPPTLGSTAAGASSVVVELAAREPFDLGSALDFFAARLIPGIESLDDDGTYRRTLRLPHGVGVVAVAPAPVRRGTRLAVAAELRLADWRDMGPAVRRVRRLLDLDTDPLAVDAVLGADELLGPLVADTPGLRVPGSTDAFETLVRAIVGQQISVAGARTVVGRIVAAVGDSLPAPLAAPGLTHVFPTAAAVATIDPAALAMPQRRRRTIVDAAQRVAASDIDLGAGCDRAATRAALLDVAGIGPWTADYVLLRGLGDPDVFLPTDLGAVHGATAIGIDHRQLATLAGRWAPWRSYALHHLWAAAATRPDAR